MNKGAEHTLEFLLAFDGRVLWLEGGYRLKFEIRRVELTRERPHGLRYSFTLHDPAGIRLIGFDNAHTIAATGSAFNERPAAADHWHRTKTDEGRPYPFTDADTLLADFFGRSAASWPSKARPIPSSKPRRGKSHERRTRFAARDGRRAGRDHHLDLIAVRSALPVSQRSVLDP